MKSLHYKGEKIKMSKSIDRLVQVERMRNLKRTYANCMEDIIDSIIADKDVITIIKELKAFYTIDIIHNCLDSIKLLKEEQLSK